MKKISLILCSLLFSAFYSNAQIVKIDTVKSRSIYKKSTSSFANFQAEYNYSVGLKFLSIEQLPKILNATDPGEYYSSKLNGLMIKFNDNQISYRISGSLFEKDISFENECKDCEQTTGTVNDLQIKVGFEKNITSSRVQPYFGFDFGFRNNKFKGESLNTGLVNNRPSYDVNTEKNSVVASPVAGLKINLVNHLTLSGESGIDFMYSYERQTKALQDASRTQTFQKFNKFEFLTRPLAFLSLQYNFGLNN
ncbi:hypothetical protein [Daejeonella oryzae]|uniref:hypothetical protein n=1 Tax=Daejeonella oryzae TaxID=1122943 RepID=UPI0003F6AE5B|nr:hypothetical protein [Daejeonella oryzae]